MSQTRSLFPLFALCLLPLAAAPADARETHLNYEAQWGGLHVADFALSLIDGGETYENRFHLETRGMLRYFTNMTVVAKSFGRVVAPPPPADTNGAVDNAAAAPLAATFLAERYRTEYTNTKHFRWVEIQFNAGATPAQAVTGTKPLPGREDRWNPAEQGPEVLDKVEPHHLLGVSDPITMIPQMIAMVRAHLEGGPAFTVIKGFDGRRRFDMDVTFLGPATRTIGEVPHDTYRVRVTPKPIAGFKERHRVLWNGSTYDFYLSRDERLVPLQIVPQTHGPVLTLKGECAHECEIAAEVEE